MSVTTWKSSRRNEPPSLRDISRRFLRENGHYGLTLLLAAALTPALFLLRIPVRFAWNVLLGDWLGLCLQSVFFAVLLYVLGFPWRETVAPVWNRYRRDRGRLLLFLTLSIVFFAMFGPGKGFLLGVDALALLEFSDRLRDRRVPAGKTSAAVLLPAAYLFCGLLLVFAYNDVIVSLRFYGAFDGTFEALDGALLSGRTVPEMAHAALRELPAGVFRALDFFYFAMFLQIGAGILLTALGCGKGRALQFVGAILTAYYLALALFFLFPSLGPFSVCVHHFESFPAGLRATALERDLVVRLEAMRAGARPIAIGADYFIAFPCMHITQPLIVLWFLWRWRRIRLLLIGLDMLLLPAILLLEWHYVVDLAGGVAVAILAIWIVGGREVEAPETPRTSKVTLVPVSDAALPSR